MGKRVKKPTVKPEVARKWLQRFEDEGEPISSIATSDSYDARTVRKQIEKARLQMEAKDVRQAVLKEAVQKHHADILSFVEKLKTTLTRDEPSALNSYFKDDPMYRALREHMPRIRLWRNITKSEQLVPKYSDSKDKLRKRIRDEIKAQSNLDFMISSESHGLSEGLIEGLMFHLQSVARDEQGLNGIDYKLQETDHGIRIERGAFGIALVPKNEVQGVQNLLDMLIKGSVKWEEYQKLQRVSQEFLRVRRSLQDELTKIILKRFVSGECRYCPI